MRRSRFPVTFCREEKAQQAIFAIKNILKSHGFRLVSERKEPPVSVGKAQVDNNEMNRGEESLNERGK